MWLWMVTILFKSCNVLYFSIYRGSQKDGFINGFDLGTRRKVGPQ